MTEAKGALFFWKDHPNVVGVLLVGDEFYELVGVRRTRIMTEFTGQKIHVGQQLEMLDDGSGDGAG
jgi:hypothetical protein